MPIRAPPRCPPNRARGCAAGARVRPNRNTADPPNDAKRNGDAGGATRESAKAMPAAAPSAHHNRRKIGERCIGLRRLKVFVRTETSEYQLITLTAIMPVHSLSLIHISEPTRRTPISYAV